MYFYTYNKRRLGEEKDGRRKIIGRPAEIPGEIRVDCTGRCCACGKKKRKRSEWRPSRVYTCPLSFSLFFLYTRGKVLLPISSLPFTRVRFHVRGANLTRALHAHRCFCPSIPSTRQPFLTVSSSRPFSNRFARTLSG